MKKIAILSAVLLSLWLAWSFFQPPEFYLKKKTQYLIETASAVSPSGDMAMLSRVSKMAKYIHFDVYLKAEYEGRVYTARSLNEFRSLLLSYFKYKNEESMDYKNLTASVEHNKKKATVNFDAFFERNKVTMFCKAILEWIKEKKMVC